MTTEQKKQIRCSWVRYFNNPAVKIPNPYDTATTNYRRVVPRVMVNMGNENET